jgi:VanZ family protein
MLRISTRRLAQVAIGLLIVVVIRTLSEILRLYNPAIIGSNADLRVYVIGSLAAAVAALATHIFHALGHDRLVLLVTSITIIALLIYKMTQPI